MTTTEILIAAKALLTPERWGQDDLVNIPVVFMPADKLCAGLALQEIVDIHTEAFKTTRQVFYQANHINSFATWNDSHTYQEVLEGFDKAIQLAQQEEATV